MKNSIARAACPILFLFLIVSCQNAWAQNNVAVLRYVAGCQKRTSEARFSEWKDVDGVIKVVLDFDRMVIQFYNKAETKFDLLHQTESGKDRDGDDYFDYEAIDEEGIRCSLRIIIDNRNDNLYLYAFYNNITLGFLLRR